jgi:NitT/TauT family transport system ATP-binding protein
MTDQPSVVLDHVTRTFVRRHRPPLVAVTDFSLRVGDGEFVALVGASGCGKTTVLRMIADLQQPSEGTITRSSAVSTRGGTSMVFQRPALLPWRTVLDNVLAPMEVLGKSKREAMDAARGLLRGVGLADFEASHPAQLSGGMQQRVALCRALISDPVLLLMDEPFAALDAITRERLMLELQRIWMEHRTTVVFVTHNIEEAAFLADRVAVMTPRPGRLAELIEVDIPRLRTLDTLGTPEFVTLTRHIRTMTVELADAETTALATG